MNQIQQQIQQLQQQLQQEEQARPLNPDSTYGFAPESQDRSYPVGNGGNLNVKAALGNEYLPPTLFEAICALGGDYSAMNKVLLQRIQLPCLVFRQLRRVNRSYVITAVGAPSG